MTVAVSRAKGRGAEAVICASTGNTAASAAAYAARAGMRGAVIVPEGKIAIGKLAQALMHGARVVALQGNFDDALRIVRELAAEAPDRAGQLGQPAPDRRPEDGRLRGRRGAGRGARGAGDPGRQRRQRHRLLARLPGGRRRRRSSTASRPRARRRWSAASRSPTPRPSPRRSGSATRPAGRRRWPPSPPRAAASPPSPTSRSSTPTAGSPPAKASSASPPRPPRSPACSPTACPTVEGAPPPESVVCVLTGHGLKDPDTALSKAPAGDQLRERPQRRRARGLRLTARHRLVRVPASSANLGPGYDVLAAAVSLYLELEVEETGEFSLDPGGLDVSDRPRQPDRARLREPALRPTASPSGCAARSRWRGGSAPAPRRSSPASSPPTTSSSWRCRKEEMLVAGDRAGGPPRQRRRGDLRRLRRLRRGRRGRAERGPLRPAGRARGRSP